MLPNAARDFKLSWNVSDLSIKYYGNEIIVLESVKCFRRERKENRDMAVLFCFLCSKRENQMRCGAIICNSRHTLAKITQRKNI